MIIDSLKQSYNARFVFDTIAYEFHHWFLSAQYYLYRSLAGHIGALKGKLHYLRGQLAPILWRASPRFSASLFRTLAMPLFRLAMPLYDLTGREDQDTFRVSIRRSFRGFLSLPRSAPNRIVEGILGDLGPLAQGVGEACDILEGSRRRF
jgi:hypothetical protein